MLSVQECKSEISRMLNRVPENKLEELLDYITFLSTRYSTKTKPIEQRKKKNSLVDFFRESPLYGINLELARDRDFGREVEL